MLRIALAVALGFSIVSLAGMGTISADDKKAETKTLEGKLVCTKCKPRRDRRLRKRPPREGRRQDHHLLHQRQGQGEEYHKCSGEQAAKVTGKVSKDGDKM